MKICRDMTYAELCTDLQLGGNTGTLQSYKNGNIINVRDKILDANYWSDQSNPTTLVRLDTGRSDISDWLLCFIGDKRSEYSTGSTVTIPVHVKQYMIDGEKVIWLEEWYIYYMGMMGTPE